MNSNLHFLPGVFYTVTEKVVNGRGIRNTYLVIATQRLLRRRGRHRKDARALRHAKFFCFVTTGGIDITFGDTEMRDTQQRIEFSMDIPVA
jgi:hypothetical protein